MKSLVAVGVGLVLVGAAAYGVSTTMGDDDDGFASRYGGLECVESDGLPGAAVGRLYSIIGDEPRTIDGRRYAPGERIFLGYCDANGKAIVD